MNKKTQMALCLLLALMLCLTACAPAQVPDPTDPPDTTAPVLEQTEPQSTTQPPEAPGTSGDLDPDPTATTEPHEPDYLKFLEGKAATEFDDLEIPAEAPRQAKELEMDEEAIALAATDGFVPHLAYESEGQIVFCNSYGLFVYDLAQEKITFSLDYLKVFGLQLAQQGSAGACTQVSADGRRIVAGYGVIGGGQWNPEGGYYEDWYSDCLYIDLEEGTYYKAPYEVLEDAFYVDPLFPDTGDFTCNEAMAQWRYLPDPGNPEVSYALFAPYVEYDQP